MRLPIPVAADQAKSRKLMKEVFAAELDNRAPAARRALARKLLDEAAKMPDASADRFVVLGGAIQSAVDASTLVFSTEIPGKLVSDLVRRFSVVVFSVLVATDRLQS